MFTRQVAVVELAMLQPSMQAWWIDRLRSWAAGEVDLADGSDGVSHFSGSRLVEHLGSDGAVSVLEAALESVKDWGGELTSINT